MNINRDHIINALKTTLEPLPYIHAMWEGGAAAFNRVDAYSDIDLIFDADDEKVAETMQMVESTLAELAPIELKYEIPQPTWHGHSQTFFRLTGSGPFLLIDVAVVRHNNPNKFLEREIHGNLVIHFDKDGTTGSPDFDPQALHERLQGRVKTLKVLFDLFQSLTLKEIKRTNWIEAIAFYQAYTLRPLIEALRIRDGSPRHAFATRYIYYDLPAEDIARLEALYFVSDGADLQRKHSEAVKWFWEVTNQVADLW